MYELLTYTVEVHKVMDAAEAAFISDGRWVSLIADGRFLDAEHTAGGDEPHHACEGW